MIRRRGALGLALLLGACVPKPSPPIAPPPIARPAPVPTPTPSPVPPANARSLGLRPGPAVASLPVSTEAAQRALAAFRISCPSLLRRNDTSGIRADWRAACDHARTEADAQAFFATAFETAQVGDGAAMVTGYYEPEIAAAHDPAPGLVPVLRLPPDLVEQQVPVCPPAIDPLTQQPNPAACPLQKQRGRIVDGQYIPYYDRAEIEQGALAGQGLEIGWADPIDLFFLQIQGSGRLRFADGSIVRIGYAGQNGHPYTGIGSLMRQRGLLGPGQASMQGMVAWLRANPEAGTALMHENRSYVFFRELTGAGPLGALGLPVTPQGSVAADPLFTPLGAPVFVDVEHQVADGLWIAQDTGGAIKGPNRFDTFWGAGEQAAQIAGGLLSRGKAWLLLPIGTLDRLAQEGNSAGAPAQR
ncbi:murein transglycosylase A [Sphingomonas sp. ID1715]|uniref:murein transglycosylase A n=1 Tax=Sphingomonas sp. ID1715 TaxID=1656898 RepID=UPI001797369A|nr:murein transglycosylase A [Sphingomonas sp. ID1715]